MTGGTDLLQHHTKRCCSGSILLVFSVNISPMFTASMLLYTVTNHHTICILFEIYHTNVWILRKQPYPHDKFTWPHFGSNDDREVTSMLWWCDRI